MSSAVTLGGKGSSLSSSTVYAIATAQSKIRIDSSALNRLSLTTSSSKQKITIPNFLTLQETRAFLTVLLNKLLLFGNYPPENVQSILESLNCDRNDFDVGDKFDITDHYQHYALLGVSSVLDHQLTGLLGFADVAAAFSCEALKADVTVFNLMNSGDGHSSKEEVGVAASMRTLLNDSKFVGREIVYQVCNIVTAHGMIRENAKSLHSRIRVELNSDHNKEKLTIGSEPMCCVLLSLAMSLKVLGQGSLARANCNLSSIDRRHDFYSGLFDVFKKE